jgi:hypothetical protein
VVLVNRRVGVDVSPETRGAAGGIFGGYSLKQGALTTGMDRGVHPAKPKGLGPAQELQRARRVPGIRLEGHPLSGVC